MAEKVAKIGVKRETGYLYFLRGSDVYKTPMKRAGGPSVAGKAEKTYFARVINSDEYNAAPGFYRATSTDLGSPTIANFIRFDDVEAAADGTIVVSVDCITTGYDRGTGVSGSESRDLSVTPMLSLSRKANAVVEVAWGK